MALPKTTHSLFTSLPMGSAPISLFLTQEVHPADFQPCTLDPFRQFGVPPDWQEAAVQPLAAALRAAGITPGDIQSKWDNHWHLPAGEQNRLIGLNPLLGQRLQVYAHSIAWEQWRRNLPPGSGMPSVMAVVQGTWRPPASVGQSTGQRQANDASLQAAGAPSGAYPQQPRQQQQPSPVLAVAGDMVSQVLDCWMWCVRSGFWAGLTLP